MSMNESAEEAGVAFEIKWDWQRLASLTPTERTLERAAKWNVNYMQDAQFAMKLKEALGFKMSDTEAPGEKDGGIEVATWSHHAAWSNESGLTIWNKGLSEKHWEMVLDRIEEHFPITGGGVPGSYGYKGSGWHVKNDKLAIWHNDSFGIGD